MWKCEFMSKLYPFFRTTWKTKLKQIIPNSKSFCLEYDFIMQVAITDDKLRRW